ncbi:major facilitator superfamily domain-containing protein [Cercophora scortea]|uniref:Major facilitator superfamily domain-containing protein n=1 Tax=Cercophora scortea TaxID=314031 RepID=A0AAE0I9W8_9PEZI|nr:major facilitator superfamily domain-containing protein [Cercophora scortea]
MPLDANLQPPPRRAVRRLLLLVALVSLSWSLYQLPLNRVIERRLCREYYTIHDPSVAEPDGTVREEFCKVEPVQQGLGRIQGVMETMWVVGDFLMTVPLVTLAERYGHRAVLMLNLIPRMFLLAWTFAVGYFDQALPLNAIMVAPLFSFLGGDCVLNSIVYSLVASSTDDDVLRATFFGQMNAVSSIFAYQLGPALASASMQRLLWLPFWIGIVLLLLAVPVASTLPSMSTAESHHHRQGGPSDDSHDDMAPLLPLSPRKPSLSFAESVASRMRMVMIIVISYPGNFTLLLCGFFLTSLASSDTKLLTQYISNRYKWKFTSVGYLLSGKAVFNFVLLYFVIPAVLRWRRARPRPAAHAIRSGQQKLDDWSNIGYAHVCLVFSVLGAVAIGLASTIWLLIPSLLLYALGIALPMFTYSLLRSPTMSPSKRDIAAAAGAGADAITVGSTAQIFSIVMLVKTVGMLVGAPLIASLWVYGVGVGGIGLGLPYFVSAACYGLVIVIFSRMRENIHDDPIP